MTAAEIVTAEEVTAFSRDDTSAFPIVVVMGVSGSGKTAIGRALGVRLDWRFRDGDEFHGPANIEKMRAGEPLDDADRAPWLAAIARWMDVRSGESDRPSLRAPR